jgi:predicted ester cyclase
MMKRGERSMSLEKNKALVRKGIEEFNKRNIAKLDEVFAPDYVDHYHQLEGLEKYKQFLTLLLKAFPDWRETIEDMVAEGDKVWFRFRAAATHTGEFRGYFPLIGKAIRLAPTGKKITPTGFIAYRIVEGKIAEAWEVSNLLDIYTQLGVIEYKGFSEDVS